MSIFDQSNVMAASPEKAKQLPYVIPNPGQFEPGVRELERYFEATPCEGPDCKNIVPAGPYSARRTRSFCSDTCRRRDTAIKYEATKCLIGTCPHCGGPVMGRKSEAGDKTFCCDEHWRAHVTEEILAPTGVFRALIEEYMSSAAANYYASGTLRTVRASLAKFFSFIVRIEEITSLDKIRSSAITHFIAAERQRGLSSQNFVGHLSTFFRWLIAEERYDHANPVLSRIHHQRSAPTAPRPYSDHDLRSVWEPVQKSGKLELMLAFAIGEECGLRAGEVANIRLTDIDASAQTIYVRLPTKNMRARTVPFHTKVKKYLELCLKERGSGAPDDHLLLNKASHPFTTGQLDFWFKKLLSKEPDPAGSFCFHRLRHTWATRLMNNGMELAVLKVLGGWESWNSMQKYIKVLDSTVRTQYESSYAKLQEKAESGEDEAVSLVDFVLMDDTTQPTVIDSVA